MSDEKRVELDTVLSRGFDAGNYCNAYETQDFDEAKRRRWNEKKRNPKVSRELVEAYHAAFTLGFFGTYELHEMGVHEETYREAYASKAGQRCVELGFVDARELDGVADNE